MVWGSNRCYQLGDGTRSSKSKPVLVQDLNEVKQIAAGNTHSIALKNNGEVVSWGQGDYGQLGNGQTLLISTTPVSVTGLSRVKQVDAGGYRSLALLDDTTVADWGYIDAEVPVPVHNLTGVKQISASSSQSLALLEDKVMIWGSDVYDTTLSGDESDPPPVILFSSLDKLTQVASGENFSLALVNGKVLAWEFNGSHQLGDRRTAIKPIPQPVSVYGLSEVKQIAAGSFHSLAINNDGTVKAWGSNDYGQLGNGRTRDSSRPVLVTGLLSKVTQIAAGGYHSLALLDDGRVMAWGANSFDQLGDQATPYSSEPVLVPGLSGVKQIAAGDYHSLALLDDGRVMAWGYNEDGQLGNGTTEGSSVPVLVHGLSGVKQIAAGTSHSIALLEDSKLLLD